MSSTSSSLPSLPSSCSPQTARKLIEPVVAKLMEAQLSGRSEAVAADRSTSSPRRETSALEVRTYAVSDDGDRPGAVRFVVELSSRVSTLVELAPRLLRTLREDLATVIGESRSAYMPNSPYDKHGSTVRRLANDYVTVHHVITTSDVEEVEVHGRIELVDILLDDGWELIAQSAHHTPVLSHSADGSIAHNASTVVETWVKKL